MSSSGPDVTSTAEASASQLLPQLLWDLPLLRLRLPPELTARCQELELLTVGDALTEPLDALLQRGLADDQVDALREALARALHDGLRQFERPDADDWPSLEAQLLGPLDPPQRRLLSAVVGIDTPAQSRTKLQQMLGHGSLDEQLDALRQTLAEHNCGLLRRLHDELVREFRAFDGVLHPSHAASGSVVDIAGTANNDHELGLRLAAFCLPHLCHLHRGVLHGVPPRRFRELLRTLPQLVPQHRLPLPIDEVTSMLAERSVEVPRGVLLHVLRTECHTAIEIDGQRGEVAVPDRRTKAVRLAELLQEHGEPMALPDLVFAYRERFRFASQQRLYQHLARNRSFVQLGAETWGLRSWYEQDLSELQDLTEAVARQIAAANERQNVHALVQGERDDAARHTSWLVLDRLRDDPRVRLLGRGEAVACSQHQSSTMRRLHKAFRKAAGDVVKSLFLQNQPAEQRRLVERLLEHNRAFVKPEPDRIDVLTNYPFNAERMERLIQLVLSHLQQRAGYAQAEALKDVVDGTDLGGKWLSPQLLTDILRRNGPFDVLEPRIIALSDLSLPQTLRRSARQALRQAGTAITIPELVRMAPHLAEFRTCLARLLADDPLVQSPDGIYFVL